MLTYLVILPLVASYLWTLDEIMYGSQYRSIPIHKPLLTISVPRAGTTSFHRTLALDVERFATPTMLELVMPFICVHKLVFAIRRYFPTTVMIHLEGFLKYMNHVTKQVEARHPISLFSPDADDILLGEWHWVSVGAVRTFPVKEYWQKHYQMMSNNDHQERRRSLQLHYRMCQKVLYNNSTTTTATTVKGNNNDHARGDHPRRLLLHYT